MPAVEASVEAAGRMKNRRVPETTKDGADRGSTFGSSVVEGEITTTVRLVRLLILALIAAAVVAGIIKGFTTLASGEDAVSESADVVG